MTPMTIGDVMTSLRTPLRPWTLALLTLVCLWPLAARAQTPVPTSNQPPAQATPIPDKNNLIDESFSIRLDEDLYQLEEAVSLIASSLSKVNDRASTLAINSFYFGHEVGADFRRKAEVVILDKVFVYNPNIRLVQCQECQTLDTKIVRGVLKLRKGIPNQETRIALAQKLQVDGFIDIGMFQNNGQLTVYLKVTEAKSGAIILVDELVGRRASRRRALAFSFGEMTFPILINNKPVQHHALLLSVQESVKLTPRFSFGVDLIFWTDKNKKNPDPHITLKSGMMLIPTLGFDILQMPSSTSRVVMFLGVGKLLSSQMDYANLYRAGIEFIVGDRMSVLLAYNRFTEVIVDTTGATTLSGATAGGSATTDKLTGGGNELRFGYRF
ncbi:MAG: hypothetical protein OEW39_07125 [Deltaproteobacteria bacterium]|nr:hypothetical protein [Deltaproteobacteria bacterium]